MALDPLAQHGITSHQQDAACAEHDNDEVDQDQKSPVNQTRLLALIAVKSLHQKQRCSIKIP
jgi:hypothetical protein